MIDNENLIDSKEKSYNSNEAKVKDNELVFLKRYGSKAHAEEIRKLLESNQIDAKIDSNIPVVDVTFVSNTHNDQFEILVKSIDFKAAKSVLEKENLKLLENLSKDHYLYQFTDKELYDILLRPDEWGDLDSALAVKILEDRGKPVDFELLESLKSQRIEDLSKPEEGQTPWIIVGYLSALFGGILGVIIGYSLWKVTKTLPNGNKVYSYAYGNRKHGKYIFILSLVMLVIWILLRIMAG